jgi:lipopolysaccharide biosynthesis glycosyltransferase
MPEPIALVVASDANFLFGLQTTVASVILHERLHPIEIHLLDSGMRDWQWDSLVATATRLDPRTRLTRHRIALERFENFHISGEYTKTTYARILAPLFVPDPFAVYIDSDFVVTKPISDLLPHLNSGKAVGAAQQAQANLTMVADCPWGKDPSFAKYLYVNAGILLLNLDKWRKDQITEALLLFLKKESAKCTSLDQSAINWLLRDDIHYLPAAWNVLSVDYHSGAMKPGPGEVNLHFASGMKPWTRRLPSLSHRIWWLFNQVFPPASRPPNPLFNPRNLQRYLRHRARAAWKSRTAAPAPGDFEEWNAYFRKMAELSSL